MTQQRPGSVANAIQTHHKTYINNSLNVICIIKKYILKNTKNAPNYNTCEELIFKSSQLSAVTACDIVTALIFFLCYCFYITI